MTMLKFVEFLLELALVDKSFTIFQAIDYIVQHKPNAKILYLVFNKANQIEAEQKLLRKYALTSTSIEVATAHSFALDCFRPAINGIEVLSRLDKDIIFSHQSKSYKRHIRSSKHAPFHWLHDKFGSSKLVLDSFCEDMENHFDDFYNGPDAPKDCAILAKNGTKEALYGIPVDAYSCVTREHIDVFKDIMNEHYKKHKYTHSMYLKAAAYSNKIIYRRYDRKKESS